MCAHLNFFVLETPSSMHSKYDPLNLLLRFCVYLGKELPLHNINTAIISVGTIGNKCIEIADELNISHYDLRFVKPLNIELLNHIFNQYKDIIVIEEGQGIGGVASTIMLEASKTNGKAKIHSIAIKDHFVGHGSMEILYQNEGLGKIQIIEQIHSIISQSVK